MSSILLLLFLCSLSYRKGDEYASDFKGDEYIEISKASGKFTLAGEYLINVEDPKIPPLVYTGFKIP